MQSVPETKSMKDFRTSTVPSLRLKDSSFHLHHEFESSLKESTPDCRFTNLPAISVLPSSLRSSATSYLPRNASFARGHLRSRSSISCLAPPPISRAQSMPGFNSTGHILAPQNPSAPRSSPNRIRSPRKPVDEVFIGLPNRNLRSVSATTQTDSFKDEQTPRAFDRSSSPISLNSPSSARVRRPPSPRFMSSQNAAHVLASSNTSVTSSPTTYSPRPTDSSLGPSYCYSGSLSYPGTSSLSIPSTPTSARSRSPSISSLETIPDSPDAEEAALEAERLARLKVAVDAADNSSEPKSKTVQDIIVSRARLSGVGFSRDKRKRWSVCGAERRGDLNLGTIWED